ncbi:hypothetical protein AB0A91_29310 [Streptomyces sp. NPDC042207]|uniref:hypothetical protein n=1 Tax=Streptomyces sp. NPDC042207 TaxID=3154331 RepID=UPI0033C43187
MATLKTQTVALSGLSPTYASATSGGDKCQVGDRVFLHIKNGSASSVTVTLTATAAVRGQAVNDLTVPVPASGDRMIGPLPAELLASPTDGLCAIGYSASASVTVAALRI